MRLIEAKIGDIMRVVAFGGGKADARLLQVGLFPGDQVRVLREAPLGGPLLVDVGGRELALGREVAAQIIVEAA